MGKLGKWWKKTTGDVLSVIPNAAVQGLVGQAKDKAQEAEKKAAMESQIQGYKDIVAGYGDKYQESRNALLNEISGINYQVPGQVQQVQDMADQSQQFYKGLGSQFSNIYNQGAQQMGQDAQRMENYYGNIAGRTELPGQALIEQRISSNTGQSIGALRRAGGGAASVLGNISNVYRNQQTALQDLGMEAARYRSQNEQNYGQAMGQAATMRAQGTQMKAQGVQGQAEMYGQGYANRANALQYGAQYADKAFQYNQLLPMQMRADLYGQEMESYNPVYHQEQMFNAEMGYNQGMYNQAVQNQNARAQRWSDFAGNVIGIVPSLIQKGGSTASTASTVAAPSDIKTKKNIKQIGIKEGHKIYEFEYKTEIYPELPKGKQTGVIAQEVIKTRPDAVIKGDKYLMVDYNKLWH